MWVLLCVIFGCNILGCNDLVWLLFWDYGSDSHFWVKRERVKIICYFYLAGFWINIWDIFYLTLDGSGWLFLLELRGVNILGFFISRDCKITIAAIFYICDWWLELQITLIFWVFYGVMIWLCFYLVCLLDKYLTYLLFLLDFSGFLCIL